MCSRTSNERGFTLVELSIAMSMSAVLLAATYYVAERVADTVRTQDETLNMNREARFALEHIRRDLMMLGSNSTPNSLVDGHVCPKPTLTLHAVEAAPDLGGVYDKSDNKQISPLALKMLGTFDTQDVYHTVSITNAAVVIANEGQQAMLTAADWNAIFNTNHYLRVVTRSDTELVYPIVGSDFPTKTVTLSSAPPKVDDGQKCGFQGYGDNLDVFVLNFIRYRIVMDTSNGAPTDRTGQQNRSVLVRERLGTDGTTVVDQLVIAENVIDLELYDTTFDLNQDPSIITAGAYSWPEDISDGGLGLLGSSLGAIPQRLLYTTVTLSVRSAREDPTLPFAFRSDPHGPITRFEIDPTMPGSAHVTSVAGRVVFPALIARNMW